MPTATARRTPVAVAPGGLALHAQLRAAEAELNTLFFERADAIRTIIITLLAGENGFIEGDPGTGKSDLLETLCKAILGGKYTRFLMDKQMGPEDLFGPRDIPKFVAGQGWERQIEDTISDSHVVLLDEAGRTSQAVMGMLLTAINEKLSKPNGHWIPIPLLSAWGASNSWIFDENPAFADRFLINLSFDTLREDVSWARLLDRACDGVSSKLTSHVVLEDLVHAVKVDVPAVKVPPGVRDSMLQLRSDLKAEQVEISPRRFFKMANLVRAAAFFDGTNVATEDHLAILRHSAWTHPDQRRLVERKVLAMTSPTTKAAMELMQQLDELSAEIDARKGKSVAERAAYGAQVQYNLQEIRSTASKEREAAARKGRSATALDAVDTAIKDMYTKTYVECMNIAPSVAANMA